MKGSSKKIAGFGGGLWWNRSNTDGDTWTFRWRHGDWPADSQPWNFPRLAFQAVAKPLPGAHSHANPPIKPLQHVQRARGSKVTKGNRLTNLHDLRAHEQGDVDANRLVV